jgi:hypothetical protein
VTVTDSSGAATAASVTISASKNGGSASSTVYAYSIKSGPTAKTKKQAKPARTRAVSRGPSRQLVL